MELHNNGWLTNHEYIALLEAKKAFKRLHFDEDTQTYKPVVSNDTLAQYLGEAVVTWRANRTAVGDQ